MIFVSPENLFSAEQGSFTELIQINIDFVEIYENRGVVGAVLLFVEKNLVMGLVASSDRWGVRRHPDSENFSLLGLARVDFKLCSKFLKCSDL